MSLKVGSILFNTHEPSFLVMTVGRKSSMFKCRYTLRILASFSEGETLNLCYIHPSQIQQLRWARFSVFFSKGFIRLNSSIFETLVDF